MKENTSSDNKYIKIQNASINLFHKQGIDNTSMQEIANEAEVAKGTIYLYFKNREDLVQSVVFHCFEQYKNAFLKGINDHQDNTSKLKYSIKETIIWAHNFKKEAAVIAHLHQPVNLGDRDKVIFSEIFNINKNIISNGIENGEFKKLPLEFLATMYFGAVEGITKFLTNNEEFLDNEILLEEMLDTMIDVIRL